MTTLGAAFPGAAELLGNYWNIIYEFIFERYVFDARLSCGLKRRR